MIASAFSVWVSIRMRRTTTLTRLPGLAILRQVLQRNRRRMMLVLPSPTWMMRSLILPLNLRSKAAPIRSGQMTPGCSGNRGCCAAQ